MNERFKFRVWGKHKGYDVDGNFVLDPDGILGEWDSIITYEEDEYIIEQCTGLKDKNGNLIYENDLIIAPNNSHKLAIIRMENGVYGCKEYRFNGVWEMNLYDLIKHYGVEIIGNVHEQAEQKDK